MKKSYREILWGTKGQIKNLLVNINIQEAEKRKKLDLKP